MEFLDTTIVNVAVVHIAEPLGEHRRDELCTDLLFGCEVIVLPLSGYLSGLLGRKNYYLWSV